jgi:hypothetical protein
LALPSFQLDSLNTDSLLLKKPKIFHKTETLALHVAACSRLATGATNGNSSSFLHSNQFNFGTAPLYAAYMWWTAYALTAQTQLELR